MVIEYRSIADLNHAILQNLHKLPQDVSLIVGIPRSGMLPANLIALYLNKPFSDIDSFLEGRVYGMGERSSFIKPGEGGKVLIVDDSLQSGSALKKAKEKVNSIINEKEKSIVWGVVYATDDTKQLVDFYCELINRSRLFQWNIFHHKGYIPYSFMDIDGVLCPNPPVDDDGPLYIDYISHAPVLYRPSLTIDTLITCRLEKYRVITEKWLADNSISYNHLIMLDLPTKEERIKWGKHGIYKGEKYRDSTCILFIESSIEEAKVIVSTSHKPVFCTENFCLSNDTESVEKIRISNKWQHYKTMISTLLHWHNR